MIIKKFKKKPTVFKLYTSKKEIKMGYRICN